MRKRRRKCKFRFIAAAFMFAAVTVLTETAFGIDPITLQGSFRLTSSALAAADDESDEGITDSQEPPSAEQPLSESIAQVDNLVVLQQLYDEHLAEGNVGSDVAEKFESRKKALLEANPPIAVNEFFQLAAFHWQPLDVDANDSSSVNVVTRFLITKTNLLALPDGQYADMFMRLVPDKIHQQYFEGKNRSGVDFMVDVECSDEDWKAGETRLVQRKIAVPALPYKTYIWFNIFDRTGQYLGRLGGQHAGLLSLGWYAALPHEDLDLALVDGANTLPAGN